MRLLEAFGDRVEVAGEAEDGVSAVERIQELEPDIVFLDVEMPGLDGFGVLDSLGEDEWPVVIFTTAYGHYATRAFDVHALDYLLKPVNQNRLGECLDRLDRTRPTAHAKRLAEARNNSQT